MQIRESDAHEPVAEAGSSPKVPKGPRTLVVVGLAIVAVAGVLLGTLFADQVRHAGLWAGQRIGLIDRATEESASAEPAGPVQYYTCGMHPWVILPRPGDCPICHMALVPLDPAKFTGEVAIDPLVVQNMGVRVQDVTQGPLVKTIRTVGTIEYDETRVRDVNTKISGWIEELYVDSVGAQVDAGDPLFAVYSPDLFAAQEEYLSAWRNRERTGGADLLAAARTRLSYFDVTDQQIHELEQRGTANKTLVIESPHAGVVIDKHANEGMKIDPGMRVYRIADLTEVWLIATVYEYQLPYVQVGQTAQISLPYIPGQTFEGTVTYIYPYLNEKTREARVRLEFTNPDGLLKPGMFANVTLQNTLAKQRTLAPREAIIDTGSRQVAFVSLGEGRFEPRDVRLGVETDSGLVEVRSGLEPGEKVVTSGQFLLDSEAKVRESLAKMIRGEMAAEQQPEAATASDTVLETLPAPLAEAISSALKQYLAIGDQLAEDQTEGIAPIAAKLADGLEAMTAISIPTDPHFWHRHEAPGKARAAALDLAQATSLEDARLAFADLSIAVESLLRATGVPERVNKEMQVLHCPMYLQNQGGAMWVQPAGPVRNPFMGQSMLTCQDTRVALPVTGEGGGSSTASPATLSEPGRAHVAQLTTAYLTMQDALTRDDLSEATAALGPLRTAASALAEAGQTGVIEAQALTIVSASEHAASADDIDAFRESFAAISQAMLELLAAAPPDAVPADLFHAYCPMVKQDWLQAGRDIRNPYASAMLTCGTIRGAVGKDASQP